MTNEEAIEQLKDDIDTVKSIYKNIRLSKSKEHFINCYELAIQALEKQVPKKVEDIEDRAYCPSCGNDSGLGNYCCACGIKLVWSDTE